MSTSTATSHPQSHDPSSQSSDTNPTTSSQSPDATQQSIAVSAFTASLHSLGQNYTSSLVDRARTLHENSAALKSQEEQLARTTANLAKQNKEWENIADEARSGLKEIGDVQNWAELIERDLLVVEEVLGVLEEEDREEDEGRGEERISDEREDRRERVMDWDGDVDMDMNMVNGNVTGNVNGGLNRDGDGKVDAGRGEEAGKGKGKAKAKEPEKKGWFSWWW